MSFITDHFLLQTKTARRLYHEFAAPQPILDYHCHLPPKDVAENRQFQNLFEIWLEGDHYKWRAMRSNGVPERYITGDAPPYEKFLAWAKTVPHTLRNPLYHWTHLELQRYFGIRELLNADTAPKIWKRANEQLARAEFSAQGILKKFKVVAVCTTDDPADDLCHHQALARSSLPCKVYPTFRPDKALMVHRPDILRPWLAQLEKVSDTEIRNLDGLLTALKKRHDFFHALGGRLSDHGLERCYDAFIPERRAAAIFAKARAGRAVSLEEQFEFASFMMLQFGYWDAEKGWTKQLHIGAQRNNNTRLFRQLGPDTGFDSIGDWPQARALANYLDRLDQDNRLPRMVLYNLNPAANYVFGTMIGNFQDGSVPGKIQWGSGWWFLDQKEGMEWQLNALSNLGLLSRFIGMLTDSRSFMSYPRHEYFRRTLCNLLGRDVENGELPEDDALLGPLVENICYRNALEYLRLPGVGAE
ncbi:glucuronate isomerase [Fontisphaera persica]|uniref:glucuronate isomerase n=1 Tax=Fontisphaera persica TaxID=2974023 RepID=UPI0024BFF87F|nr:glucuronate isomerase [Fontisphaera persica]WCJ59913.1 glucuronate isomerase [Fontisphaera persica]